MLVLVVSSLFALVPSFVPQTVKLNGPLAQPEGGGVQLSLVGSSGTHAVYFADQDTLGRLELYGVPLDGSAPAVKLNPPLTGNIGRTMVLSADGTRIVFLASSSSFSGLWTAVADGSSAPIPVASGIEIEDSGNFGLDISPDGQWIAYREDLGDLEFVSARADGSQLPIALSTGNYVSLFRFTPDSTRLVFLRWVSGIQGLHSVPVDGSGPVLNLSGPLPAGGQIDAYTLTPDGATVVYLADGDTNGVSELYSVPTDGSAPPVKLNAPLVANGDVGHPALPDYEITADGTRVVYLADQDADEKRELYAVPLDGSSAPVKVSGTLAGNRDVGAFRLTADGRRVAFLADAAADEVVELHLAWLDGSGSPVRLNGPLASGGDVVDFQLSADGRYAVYRADQLVDARFELFAAPLPKLRRSDATRATRLNPPPVAGGMVTTFFIDAGSRSVVYRGDLLVDGVEENFSVPIGGGPSVRLTPPLGPGGSSFAATPAPGGFALFLFRADANDGLNLLSAPADGSAPAVQLNEPFAPSGFAGVVSGSLVTADGTRAVYVAQADYVFYDQLFSVASDGSAAPLELSGPMPYTGTIGGPAGPLPGSFALSPDSQRCAYIANQDSLDRVELYGAPLDGSTPSVRLNDAFGPDGDVQRGLLFSPDSSRVVCRAHLTSQGIEELYSVPADGSASPVLLNGTMLSTLADVEPDFAVSANSARVVYRSDETSFDKHELFSVPLDGSAARTRISGTLGASRDVESFALDPTSQRVVFVADLNTEDALELYVVPLAGGSSPLRLNDAVPANRDVLSFRISPDGARVVYVVDQLADERYELFSVPLDRSSAPVKLSGTLAAGGDVHTASLQIGSNGRVAYMADQDVDGRDELYSAPLDGSAAALKLNSALVAGGDVKSYQLTAGVARAVYLANATSLGADELFVVPLDGSASALQLSGAPGGRSVDVVALDPNGLDAAYRTHPLGDLTQHELFHVPLDGSQAPNALTGVVQMNEFTIAAGASRAVFRADGELYSAPF